MTAGLSHFDVTCFAVGGVQILLRVRMGRLALFTG